MTESPRFWDRIADKYARSPVSDQASYERKLDESRAWFTPQTEILEIGCGTGSTAIAHAPYVKSILATDISGRMIEIAREKAQAADAGNVRFEAQAISGMEIPEGRYDVVMAHSILHLVDDYRPVIRDIHRWLKPGGLLIASTACLGDALGIFRYIGPIGSALGLIPTVRVFKRAQLEQHIMDTGFSIESAWQPGRISAVFTVARKGIAENNDPRTTANVREPGGVVSSIAPDVTGDETASRAAAAA